MKRFAIFVDGSNLHGSLRAMNLEVDDYESLFAHVYKEAVDAWRARALHTERVACELRRVYWYVVASMDDWDLKLPQSQTALRNAFAKDKEIRDAWLAEAGKANPGVSGPPLEDKAWAACFNDFDKWYGGKWSVLHGLRNFYQGVRISTDLIDIIEAGHWKVNFIHKWVEEKGLDTSLAVDLVALEENYDVAVVVSGDADAIPAIKHLKNRDKQVLVMEFISGSPPESKGRTFSSRLKEHADIVTRIYETDLIRHKIGHRPKPKAP